MVSLGSSRLLGAVTILAYSVVPLIGVLLFGWDWREILVFYWLGNISAGISVLLDIFRKGMTVREFLAQRATPDTQMQEVVQDLPVNIDTVSSPWLKVVASAFFTMHFGMFTLIHGIFVFAIVNENIEGLGVNTAAPTPLPILAIFLFWLVGAVVQLTVKSQQAQRYKSATDSMKAAYSRMTVLHLSIIFGAFLIASLQLPAIAAVLLIVVNAVVDLRALRSSRKAIPVAV